MKITVFTSNQPRHVSLIKSLASVAEEVYAIQECNTLFPGVVDDFFKRSDVMQVYFKKVGDAEKIVFGMSQFLPSNVRSLSLKMGDLNRVGVDILAPAMQSDLYVVFGSSYIKGSLIEFLVGKRSINIHMGVSPFYRGNSCNFWALYDGKPEYVGATIHLLSRGLDSGKILFHAVPKPDLVDPFLLGMSAVRSAHNGLMNAIVTGKILEMDAVDPVSDFELRYTKNKDFNDEVASIFLDNLLAPQRIFDSLEGRDFGRLINPYVG